MTALKQLKLNDIYNREEFSSNEFQFDSVFPETNSDWNTYLKKFDVSLKEDLPLDMEYFHALSEVRSINEIWKDLITEHPLRQQIQKSIEELTPLQKQVIHLSFWEGLSLRAIAKEMNMSKSNVSRHRDRAIERLRHEISKHVSIHRNSVHKI
jgi:DNA-directed RNA polymerase specialized sigma subunit